MVDTGSTPQLPIGYHIDLQVVDNFDKGWLAGVGNFDTGYIDFSPGVVGIHMVAGFHIEPENQAESDRKVEIDTHLVTGD